MNLLSRPESHALQCFASCLPGLEPLLEEELHSLGVSHPTAEAGGVRFVGSQRSVLRCNLELGLASHVLVRIAEFPVRRFPELVQKTGSIPWEQWLIPGLPFDVRASCRRSKLYHSAAVEERVARGILDRLPGAEQTMLSSENEGAGEEGIPIPGLRVRLVEDRCTISLDSSGAPLHKRGYRTRRTKAPLREDLARALLVVSGWEPTEPLLDPFCGSGTIPIEAAFIARNFAPGRLRRFAFESTRLFDEAVWQGILDAAEERELERAPAMITGSDRNQKAIDAARENATHAELEDSIEFECCHLSEQALLKEADSAAAKGCIVTNPPYGERLDANKDLRALYQTLGDRVRALPEDWGFAMFASKRKLAHATALALESRFLSDHGGLKVRAYVRSDD